MRGAPMLARPAGYSNVANVCRSFSVREGIEAQIAYFSARAATQQ